MKTTKSLLLILTTATALTVQVQAQNFLNGGLVAYYPFAGDANDSSGYQNNPLQNTASLAPDRFNRTNSAYNFSGTQFIQYASPAQIQDITNLTVSCWIQTTNSFGGFRGLVCKATSSNPWTGFQLGVFHSHVQIQVDLTSFTGSARINDGNWHSVCAVFDNNNGVAEIFVDGNLDTAFSTPVSSLSSPFQLNIGVERQGLNFFAGSIDEIRLFNRALTTNEVAQLYDVESAEFSLPYFNLAITLNIAGQGASNVVGVISTTASPMLSKLATKDILKVLAFDENVEGNWPSNSFPQNTTLALAGRSFVVLKGTNILLNVSDIMSFNTGAAKLNAGKLNTVTGLASPTVQNLQLAGLMFDDTFINGGSDLKFYLNGVMGKTTADTSPVNGVYTETQTIKITTAAGEGASQGDAFICTGSVSASAKSPLHL